MKLKHLIIYILLCSGGGSYAQTLVNHGCYWPPKSPNGTVRISRDSTSEDWWYDVKAVPVGHATFDTGGRFICAGYSGFDDIGVGSVATSDPCNNFVENPFTTPSSTAILNFDLPDMRHLNSTGTIGLVNLTRTTSGLNPYVWIYNYGLGTILKKVIPTSDGGFLATGHTQARNIPSSGESQYVNFLTANSGNTTIYHQTPSNSTGSSAIFNTFSVACPPANGYNVPPLEPDTRWGFKRRQACLVKVDGSGNLEWIYTYGLVQFTDGGVLAYKNTSDGTDLVETTDGYIVAGIMQNSPVYGNLGNHPFLLKVNTSGTLIWLRQYPDPGFLTEKFMALQLKNDSTVYVVGERTTMNVGLPVFSGYQSSSSWLNGNDYADKERYRTMRFLPFLKKINISANTVLWDYALETDGSNNYKARDIAINVNGDILVPVSTECNANFEQGECKNSHVDRIVDHSTYASSAQKTYFGPMRAFDLDTGLGVEATTDGGFVVVGTKKAYDISIAKNYATADPARCPVSPATNGLGYDFTNFGPYSQFYAQTDGFIAKANSYGNIEWTSIFDNTTPTPGGSFRSTAGNPRNECNLDTWMNATTGRSKRDIKRQECFYAITTSNTGEIVIGGNMSANIDDDYLALAENSCTLTLSNHIIQSIPTARFLNDAASVPITNMNNFVASTINTGRVPGNTYDVAEFLVNNNADINMEAGQEINMYEGTDLDAGTIVDIHINTAHSCTAGPVHTYTYYTASFGSGSGPGSDKKTISPANVKPQVIASPNPTNGLVTIKHPADIKQLEVFDLFGKSILKVRANDSGQTKIDFTNTSPGMYLIKIEGISQSIKIMKN